MFVKALLPKARIKCFNQSVISGFARTTEIQLNVVPISPTIEILGDELRAIITADVSWTSSDCEQVTQQFNDILATEVPGYINSKAFTSIKPKSGGQNCRKQKLWKSDIMPSKWHQFQEEIYTTILQPENLVSANY